MYTNKTPSLLCTNADDIFKTPVGLITADEVSMVGMVTSSNQKNITSYLYTGNHNWTMTPCAYGSAASVFHINEAGYLTTATVDYKFGVRPVINLKSSVLFEEGGSGITYNPYVVQGT